MNRPELFQLIAGALLLAAGFLNLLRAPGIGNERVRKNWRTRGVLFLFAGVLFLVLALGFAEP